MINVSDEKNKVKIMSDKADNIMSEVQKLQKAVSNLGTEISGSTLLSYLSGMESDLQQVYTYATYLQNDIKGIPSIIDNVYNEEVAAQIKKKQKDEEGNMEQGADDE